MSHPNIIKVFEVFEENGTVYYVMPYLSGGSLQDYVKAHGVLSENEAMKYIRQIASALKYMHEKEHICHYDVKPANILLDDKGNAILIDFGISKNYDAAGHETSTTPIGMSEGYAPIEQYQKIDEFSPVSDVYALGATLYYLLHGKRPINAPSRASGIILQMKKGLSPQIKNIINASMQLSKRERPQSVDIFLGNINTLYDISSFGDERTKAQNATTFKETTILSSLERTTDPSKSSYSNKNINSYIGWIIGIIVVAIICFFMFLNRGGTENIEVDNNVEIENPANEYKEETQEVVQEKKEVQKKTSTISENYAGKKFNYNIEVNNGILKWTYSGEGGKDSKTLNCNPDVDGDIIIAEFMGIAYWDITSSLLWEMVEEKQVYIWDLHAGAKDALGKCVSYLSKARDNCPNAYKKAQELYKNLINAENGGGDELWEEIGALSFAMGEYPLDVCDIY